MKGNDYNNTLSNALICPVNRPGQCNCFVNIICCTNRSCTDGMDPSYPGHTKHFYKRVLQVALHKYIIQNLKEFSFFTTLVNTCTFLQLFFVRDRVSVL